MRRDWDGARESTEPRVISSSWNAGEPASTNASLLFTAPRGLLASIDLVGNVRKSVEPSHGGARATATVILPNYSTFVREIDRLHFCGFFIHENSHAWRCKHPAFPLSVSDVKNYVLRGKQVILLTLILMTNSIADLSLFHKMSGWNFQNGGRKKVELAQSNRIIVYSWVYISEEDWQLKTRERQIQTVHSVNLICCKSHWTHS